MKRHSSTFPVRAHHAPLVMVALWIATAASALAAGDPPGRVASVNYLEGSGAMQAAGVDTWSDEVLNRPLTGGDRLWIDERSRAEMHVGSTALRLGSRTAVQILVVDDHDVRLSMTAGSMSVRIRELDATERFDIETPAGVVSLQQPGGYRLDVDDTNARGFVTVWSGSAEVSGPSGSTALRDDQSAELIAGADPAVETATAGNTDSLDLWAEDRDQHEDQSAAADYVSRDVVGYQDLDGYGQWMAEPTYGMVWVPAVPVGWAPYRYGYWNWIAPWGWTWIAREPWGFAPCHYGRWVYAPSGWAWVPGPRVGAPPVYSPALVAWRGERKPRTTPTAGYRPQVGWVPLGYNEPYAPPYHSSPGYVRASNLSNTHLARGEVDRFIDDQQHGGAERRFANDTVAGAYSAAPREAFSAAYAFGPPRAVAQQPVSARVTPSPRDAWRAAPADRPVARSAPYVPVTIIDRPTAQVAGTRNRYVMPTASDRPPRPTSNLVARVQPTPRSAPSSREAQPMSGGSEPRRVYYAAAPPASSAAANSSGAREPHRSASHVERRP